MIYIGICTRERPKMLTALLESIADSIAKAEADAAVILVENGPPSGAARMAALFDGRLKIHYHHEARPGLVHARNAVVETFLAKGGDWIVFLDDDNIVVPEWAGILLQGRKDFPDADILFGPTIYTYEDDAPALLRKTVRPRPAFGRLVFTESTNNCLLHRKVFSDHEGEHRFHPAFNLSGGEDMEFFRRRRRSDLICRFFSEAVALEHVPQTRQSVRYHFRKWCHQAHCFGHVAVFHHGPVRGRAIICFLTLRDTARVIAFGLTGAFVLVFSEIKGLQRFRVAFRNLCNVLGRPRALWRPMAGFYNDVQGE